MVGSGTSDGKVSDIRGEKWGFIDGTVVSIENRVLILKSDYDRYIAITNFAGAPLDGELFRALALWKGSYDMAVAKLLFTIAANCIFHHYLPPRFKPLKRRRLS
jgi:hypothetical protein